MPELNPERPCNKCLAKLEWDIEQLGGHTKNDISKDLWAINGVDKEDGIVAERFGKWNEMVKAAEEIEMREAAYSVTIPIRALKYLRYNEEMNEKEKI